MAGLAHMSLVVTSWVAAGLLEDAGAAWPEPGSTNSALLIARIPVARAVVRRIVRVVVMAETFGQGGWQFLVIGLRPGSQ